MKQESMNENIKEITLCNDSVIDIYTSRIMMLQNFKKSFHEIMYEYFSDLFHCKIKEFNYKTNSDCTNKSHYVFTMELENNK